MKTKNFIISEIIALALTGFGYFMASSDFFRVLLGNYMPKCPEGFACIQIMHDYSVSYGYLLVEVGMLIFVAVLIVFTTNKIIKHVKS